MAPNGTRPRIEMTPTDWKVARLVAEGASNQEIASRLGLKVQTVKNRLTTIYERLGVRSRLALAMRIINDEQAEDL